MSKGNSTKAPPWAYSYIRFSDPKQGEGDSVRRQTADALDWCSANGASLDTTTTLHDLGTSAFRGDHRKNPDRNALAAFLEAVRTGRVKRGSYLLIENLDRLTREHIRPALTLLLNLIEAGIRVVQLKPVEVVYDEHVDPMQLMMAIMELSRGHSESAMKSERLGKVWVEKRNGLATKKLTGKCPAWLELDGDRTGWVVRPGVVAVVRRAFAMAEAGHGCFAIARAFNRDEVPAFNPVRKLRDKEGKVVATEPRAWQQSCVGKLLRDRAVLGEFTPHTGRKKSRTPAGETVPDYYPRVVDKATFARVQRALDSRKNSGGPAGACVANLFGGLVKDARDGATMVAVRKTAGKGSPLSLVSSGAVKGKAGSRYVTVPYRGLEAAFLELVQELKADDVTGGTEDGLADEADVLRGRIKALDQSVAVLNADLDANGDSPAVLKRLRDKEAEREAAAERLAEVEAEIDRREPAPLADVQTLAARHAESALRHRDESLSVRDRARARSEHAELRTRIKSRVRQLVEAVWVLAVDLTDGVRHAEVQVQFRAGGSRTLFLLWDYRGGRRGQRVVYTGTAPLGVPHEDGTGMDDLATALRSLGRRFPFDLRDYRGDADVRTAYADLHAQLAAEMAQRLAAG